jgi:hypothetical protein
MGFKNQQWQLGPNPDISRYVDVFTKNGWYRKQKRGTVKPAKLNESFKQNQDLTSLCSPAAKRLILKLTPWLKPMQTGYVQATICGRFKKAFKQKGKVDFSFMRGVDLAPKDTFRSIVPSFSVKKTDSTVTIGLIVSSYSPRHKNKKAKEQLAVRYFYEALLVWGNPTKDNGLRVDVTESQIYNYGEDGEPCKLEVVLPTTKKPWMVLLKINSLEEKRPSVHPGEYGMVVVEVG